MIRTLLAMFTGVLTLIIVGGLVFLLTRILPLPDSSSTSETIKIIVSILIGLIVEIPAGYMTALVARTSPFKHALVLGLFIALTAGLASSCSESGDRSVSQVIMMNLIPIPGILLGAWIWTVKNRTETYAVQAGENHE